MQANEIALSPLLPVPLPGMQAECKKSVSEFWFKSSGKSARLNCKVMQLFLAIAPIWSSTPFRIGEPSSRKGQATASVLPLSSMPNCSGRSPLKLLQNVSISLFYFRTILGSEAPLFLEVDRTLSFTVQHKTCGISRLETCIGPAQRKQ